MTVWNTLGRVGQAGRNAPLRAAKVCRSDTGNALGLQAGKWSDCKIPDALDTESNITRVTLRWVVKWDGPPRNKVEWVLYVQSIRISLHHLQECHPGAADRRTYQCAQKNDQPVHGKKYQWTTFYGGMLFWAVYHIQWAIQAFSDGGRVIGNNIFLGQILNKKFIKMKNNGVGWRRGAYHIPSKSANDINKKYLIFYAYLARRRPNFPIILMCLSSKHTKDVNNLPLANATPQFIWLWIRVLFRIP